MSVDDDLLEFENNLWDAVGYSLIVGPNWDYWREVDVPQASFFDEINKVIENAHAPMIAKYRGTAVEPILRESRDYLMDLVWTGMNVPFPQIPELHAIKVCENCTNIYNTRIYARLRTEMIMVNHNAALIQRIWKNAVTQPMHPICQRRLFREFNDLEYSHV
jgi:hypothetical protein